MEQNEITTVLAMSSCATTGMNHLSASDLPTPKAAKQEIIKPIYFIKGNSKKIIEIILHDFVVLQYKMFMHIWDESSVC